MEPLEVIDSLRAACNGRIAEVGGSFKIQVGAFGAAVFSFTDADIIVTKGQSFEPFPTLDDTINQINISYPNPDEKWGSKDGPALTATQVNDPVTGKSLFEVDGNRVLAADVQFPAVPFDRQAQRLRRAMIKEERRFRTHRFYLPPEAWVLEPNDVLSWSSDRNGYDNKRFIVTDIQGEATMNQLVTIREMDPADYDWSADFELPTTSGYLGPIEVPPQPMEGWTVVAANIPDAGGRGRRPAIIVTAASNLDDVRNVRVQVRVAATDAVVFDSDNLPYDAPYSWTLSGAWLLPATVYEVRGRLIAETSSRRTLWSTWLTVTTPNLLVIAEDILDNAITQQKIIDGAISANKIMDGAVEALKLADKAVTENKIAIGAVTKDLIASGAIVADKFAGGIGPVGIITGSTVPTTKTLEVITVAGKLYRWNGTKYTADVPAADIAGTIAGSQIADNAIGATKFANGLSPVTNVSGSTVPTVKSTDVITVAGKLYRWNGTKYTADVPAADIAGTITGGQIDAGAIDATKFASGLSPVGNIAGSTVPTTKSTDVITVAGKLYRWDGAKYTAAVPTQDLTGTVSADQIGANAITAGKIAADAITSANIQAGAINTDQLAAGAITTSKLTIMDQSNLVAGELLDGAAWNGGMVADWSLISSSASQDELGRVMIYTGPNVSGASAGAFVSSQFSNRFPVNVGEPLAVNLKVRGYAAARGQFRAEINWSDKDGADLGSQTVNGQTVVFSGTTATTAISAIMSPVAGAVTARLRVRVACDASGNFVPAVIVRSISVRRAASAELIVDGSISADKITSNAITADKISANAITSDKINANAITAGKIAADSITSANIQAGAVKAEQIAANAITAKQLTLMDMSNLVLNGDFSQLGDGWTGSGGWDFSIEGTASSPVGAFARKLVNAAGTFNLYQDGQWAVNPGEQYYIEVWTQCSGNGGVVANLRLQLQFQDATGTTNAYVRIPDVAINGTKGWSKATGSVVVPATVGGNPTAKARFWAEVRDVTGPNGGSVRIGKVWVRRMNSAELLVDGAVTADKITSNAISADKIQANAITSDKITTNAITAGKVAAGAIDTDKLAANAITADKIDTNAITAQKIAAGAITAVKIGAGAITTDKLDANAVTAAKIAAGTIGADQIAANAITARNLLLTDFSNMVPDNALQDAKSWSLGGSEATPYFSNIADVGPVIRFNGNRTASSGSTYIADATSAPFNVRPGDELRFGATIDFNSDSDNQGVRIYLNFYDANGNNVGGPSYNEPSAANLSPRNVAQNATVPATAVTAYLYIRRQVPTAGGTSAGTLYVWNPFCYRRANAELIVDGSITADKITLNSLTSINLKVTNADITDLTLNGEKLVNGAISAVYYNTSSSFIPKSATTTILSRSITLADDERLLISADWNLRGLMSVVNTEIFYAGSVQLKVGSTVLDTIKIQGPAIDTYACSSQSISGSYTKSGSGSVTVTLVFIVGSGGAMRNNDMNMGYFGTGAGFTNDGVSWTITRLKK
ncbi:phage tail protein [Rhizobium sp. Leaf383]|uniref:phage tail protein n=1 Tax=Rhizobium sp. Leaf383 TaxID=1736357 RepID=UPI0007159D5A|nr:phage tail protein [Rhizobium sp. Leaf383]KQS74521.1 hypothetical protein ASG58_16285 [Rhizobium sp. Leaf383]